MRRPSFPQRIVSSARLSSHRRGGRLVGVAVVPSGEAAMSPGRGRRSSARPPSQPARRWYCLARPRCRPARPRCVRRGWQVNRRGRRVAGAAAVAAGSAVASSGAAFVTSGAAASQRRGSGLRRRGRRVVQSGRHVIGAAVAHRRGGCLIGAAAVPACVAVGRPARLSGLARRRVSWRGRSSSARPSRLLARPQLIGAAVV